MTNKQNSSHALLLGATKGIGFALARQCLAAGQRVTLSGRSSEGVDRKSVV